MGTGWCSWSPSGANRIVNNNEHSGRWFGFTVFSSSSHGLNDSIGCCVGRDGTELPGKRRCCCATCPVQVSSHGMASVQESLQCHCSSLLAGTAWSTSLSCGGTLTVAGACRSTPVPCQWGRDLSEHFPALQGFCSIHWQETFQCELEVSLVNSCPRPRPAFFSALNPPKSSFVDVLWGQFGDNAVTCCLWDTVDSDWRPPKFC